MTAAALPRQAARDRPAGRSELPWLLVILGLALVVRLATFNGAFGSDDLVYFERAARVAHGDWSSANYNGALRYGFNLPAGALMALFGDSFFAANLWPLACSLVEIGAVFAFARAAMGRRAAVCAALLLAAAPLHVAVATRIHADAVVAMFVTLGFVLLHAGLRRERPALLFGAGLALGGIFWAKELAAVTWFAFLPMLWFFRGRWRGAALVIGGLVLMLALHGLLMFAIAGDPLHLVKVVTGALQHNFIDGAQGDDSAGYYLRYLFVDPRHVGLLAFFALASLAVVPRWLRREQRAAGDYVFALLWWLGLLLVLSLFPVSLSPLRLTMKQSNYITLFLAPTAVLAGMTIAALPRLAGTLALAACALLGLVLGAFQQADYRAFTANSKALAGWARSHPKALFVGTENNARLGSAVAQRDGRALAVMSYPDVRADPGAYARRAAAAGEVIAVVDPQTDAWLTGARPVTQPLPCWQALAAVEPANLGLGNALAEWLGESLRRAGPARGAGAALQRLGRPAPAEAYRVPGADLWCERAPS